MEEVLFRIIIVGDSGVGKSCILQRFISNSFADEHQVTIGVEFGTKSVEIQSQKVKLQFWDTAGQEGYRSITRSFYRNADGVVLAYDITSKSSFANCKFWMAEIRNNSSADAMVFLLGNQSDMTESTGKREVSICEAETFMKNNSLSGFAEVSAKTGEKVSESLLELCKMLFDRRKETNEPQVNSATKLDQRAWNSIKKKKRCC